MRWARGAFAAVVVAVIAAACGGSTDNAKQQAASRDEMQADSPEGSPTTSTTGAEGRNTGKAGGTATATGDGGSTSSGQPGSSPTPGTGGSTDNEPDGSELPSEPLPMSVELSSVCVRPGTPLTVTVKSAPQAAVGYDTTWSDGKTGWEAGSRGGTANGTTDESGMWKKTAAIGADAPEGRAKMDVIGTDATGRFGRATVEFTVSDALGKCS